MSVSVILPTVGRASLAATLESCRGADEIVVVADVGRGDFKLPIVPLNAVVAFVEDGRSKGYKAREYAMRLATSTHLAFMDDDDVFTPGAFDVMRDAACDLPVLFRIDHYEHGILWRDREVRFGNVTTQQFLVPNRPAEFGEWAPHDPNLLQPGGDYTFLKGTVEKMGGVVWRDEIVSVLRPAEDRVAA